MSDTTDQYDKMTSPELKQEVSRLNDSYLNGGPGLWSRTKDVGTAVAAGAGGFMATAIAVTETVKPTNRRLPVAAGAVIGLGALAVTGVRQWLGTSARYENHATELEYAKRVLKEKEAQATKSNTPGGPG